jgi:hypothetical protein
MTMNDYQDVDLYNAVSTRAQYAAQAAYQQSQARNEGERIALDKAKFAWQQEIDKAGLTGMFQGAFTMPVQQWQASTFGTWGAPTAGQQTLTAQQQAWSQAFQNAQAYGQYYAPGGTGPAAGQQTLAAQQQQWSQQLQAMQEARAAQAQQQQQAQTYLNLLSQLRGPADWAKYQQVLGATPQGMRDLTAAAMGQYIPGGGATTGVQPQAANLQTLQQQVGGLGGAGAQPGSENNPMGQLPLPNQIAAQSWKNLAPTQQQMLLGAYEAQGWDKTDVQSLLNQSLPKYASNAPSAGTWRLAA